MDTSYWNHFGINHWIPRIGIKKFRLPTNIVFEGKNQQEKVKVTRGLKDDTIL